MARLQYQKGNQIAGVNFSSVPEALIILLLKQGSTSAMAISFSRYTLPRTTKQSRSPGGSHDRQQEISQHPRNALYTTMATSAELRSRAKYALFPGYPGTHYGEKRCCISGGRLVPSLAPPSSFPDSLFSAERDWRKATVSPPIYVTNSCDQHTRACSCPRRILALLVNAF